MVPYLTVAQPPPPSPLPETPRYLVSGVVKWLKGFENRDSFVSFLHLETWIHLREIVYRVIQGGATKRGPLYRDMERPSFRKTGISRFLLFLHFVSVAGHYLLKSFIFRLSWIKLCSFVSNICGEKIIIESRIRVYLLYLNYLIQ